MQGIAHPAIAFAMVSMAASAADDLAKLPPSANVPVDFVRHIKPIFEQSCFRCHGPEKPRSHFRLDNRESALKGGDNNADDIVPGASGRSKLILYTARLVPDLEMPPPERGEPLSAGQVALLRAWIDQGADWSATNRSQQTAFSMSPTLRWADIEGNRSKFRELNGYDDGWGGGVSRVQMETTAGSDGKLTAEGRALFPKEDIRLSFKLSKPEVGFAQGGFEQWRKYYNDLGGYALLLPTNSFSLNRDLHLDIGRAWVDFGLLLPDLPEITLGYEYQYRNGSKSSLEWGPVGTKSPLVPGTDAKNVFPGMEQIAEHTHILKLDLRHEALGWRLEDSARGEFYQLNARRADALTDTFGPAPATIALISEEDRHAQGANTFSAGKQFADWLSVSGAYFYSRLDGDSAYRENTLKGTGGFAFGDQRIADPVTLHSESQVVSGGGLAGPWAGWTLSCGAQAEWTRQEGVGLEDVLAVYNANPPMPPTNLVVGNLDSASVREHASLRFSKIPCTITFVEGRWRKESLARYESGQIRDSRFIRNTDGDMQFSEYRAGFTTSPWERMTLSGNILHNLKHTGYLNANTLSSSDYPGFILWRDIEINQAEGRLALRPASWIKTSLTCKWVQTEFDSATPVTMALPAGGPIEAATERAHEFDANVVLTPFKRFYLSGTFSYSDSRLGTALDGRTNGLAPWAGNLYSVLASANFIVSAKTECHASFAWSKSDYGQNNQSFGLPLGVNYQRRQFQIGLARHLAKGAEIGLTYALDCYREPTSGGANNFSAHAVFAVFTTALP